MNSIYTRLDCYVCSEWSAIEKEMGDGLQSAGHHMDTLVVDYLSA